MEITGIAFELICGDYSWGHYGEFKVIINTKTGYINATQLCGLATTKSGKKKEFKNWVGVQKDELVAEVSSSAGIPAELLVSVNMEGTYEIRGTYVHPKLIPHIACWASPTFAIKVSDIINNYFIREITRDKDDKIDALTKKIDELISKTSSELEKTNTELAKTSDKLDQALGELDHMQCTLDTTVEELEKTTIAAETASEQTKAICEKLDIATELRVPKDPINRHNEVLVIYNIPRTLEYKVVRCQYSTLKASEKRCIGQGYTQQIYFKETPNAVNIFNRIKQQLPTHIGNVSRAYFVTLKPNKEADFIRFINSVDLEKKLVAE